jgi:hypothetical protein
LSVTWRTEWPPENQTDRARDSGVCEGTMRIAVETDDRVPGAPPPEAGEVWLRMSTGELYEMREWVKSDQGSYRACHRVGAPESGYGCDPEVWCACFDVDVRNGRWIRVLNCPPLPPIDKKAGV